MSTLLTNIVLIAVAMLTMATKDAVRNLDDCEPLSQPKEMPALNMLLDSAGLYQRLSGVDAPALNNVVISVRLEENASAYVAGAQAPTAIQDSMRVFVLANVRPTTKKSPLSFRVVITGGAPVRVSVERSMLCAPKLLEGDDRKVPFVIGGAGARGGVAIPMSRDAFVPILHIGIDGSVQDVTMKNGDQSSDLARNMKISYAKRRYAPALLDGRPVEVLMNGRFVELIK